jgi:RimJ/RimL family protein N-acetyltransferase
MNISFKLLSLRNLEFVRLLRNENREWFINSREIDPIAHAMWFALENLGNLNLVIYLDSYEPVGFISLYNITPDGRANIGRMMVSSNHKHQGIMTRAIIKVFALCQEFFGIYELVLEVKNSNVIARTLYTKLGFTTYGFTKDTTIMRKRF